MSTNPKQTTAAGWPHPSRLRLDDWCPVCGATPGNRCVTSAKTQTTPPTLVEQWIADCERTHGRVLSGAGHHWCREWDDMPIDETCPEFDACLCYPEPVKEAIKRGNQA